MTNPLRTTALVYLGSIVCVTAALAWVTGQTLSLERRELRAADDARNQERLRLALYRMELAVAPVIARESARPYFQYRPFYPAERGYTRMWQAIAPGDVLVPSPLLCAGEPMVRLHFQRSADGTLTSPQAPSAADQRETTESVYCSTALVATAQAHLDALRPLLDQLDTAPAFRTTLASTAVGRPLAQPPAAPPSPPAASTADALLARANHPFVAPPDTAGTPTLSPASGAPQTSGPPPSDANGADNRPTPRPAGRAAASQSEAEFQVRLQVASQSRSNTQWANDPSINRGVANVAQQEILSAPVECATNDPVAIALAEAASQAASSLPEPVAQGDLLPIWTPADSAEPELIFVRSVRVGSDELLQGLWLDWPALRAALLSAASDLTPNATLAPLTDPAAVDRAAKAGTALALIPAELKVPPAPPTLPAWTPLRTTLAIAWAIVAVAAVAIARTLFASVELAERRGRFVSAVTHELRTPLTSFCMYSQMLADGVVTDEAAKRDYLATLRDQSQRLARIVEDVLAFAKLSRPAAKAAPAPPRPVAEALDHALPALRDRAAAADLELTVSNPLPNTAAIAAPAPAVERILFNLVDNAAKYASHPNTSDGDDPTAPRRVELAVEERHGRVHFALQDFGKGVPPDERPRLFEPFVRGRRHVGTTIPGLGLGLSLARAMARDLGGDLTLEPSTRGARFVLSLPAHRLDDPGAVR